MRALFLLALAGSAPALVQTSAAQDTRAEDSSITVQSNLVVVPALVRNKSGQLVYSLKADDFLLLDNGIEQKLRVEESTGDQPLALVVCVQTGGAGRKHLSDYHGLETMLDAIVGGGEHEVAVVGFDSTPTLLHGFTPNLDFISTSLSELDAGDQGAAILDGLATSINLLRTQPPNYRRAVLLISETIDHGSRTKLDEALRAVSDTNTVIYSVAFSSGSADLRHEARKFGDRRFPPLPPGPKQGCFSRDMGTDSDGKPIRPEESKSAQNLNCVEEILPPLRLLKLAQLSASDALRQNVSEAVAKLTGGESFEFKDLKTLQDDLLTVSNHIPNRYVLSFRPQAPVAGFHSIALRLRNRPGLSVDARSSYWIERTDGVKP